MKPWLPSALAVHVTVAGWALLLPPRAAGQTAPPPTVLPPSTRPPPAPGPGPRGSRPGEPVPLRTRERGSAARVTGSGTGSPGNTQSWSGPSREPATWGGSPAERTPGGDYYAWRGSGRSQLPGPGRAGPLLDRAESLQARGDYAGATVQAEQALRLLEDSPGAERLLRARCLGLLGGLAWLRGDYVAAEPQLLGALAVYEEGVATNHPDVASLLNRLAILYQAQGMYGRAESLHQRALAIQEAVLGKNHPDVAASLNNLAILYKAQGMYGLAESFHQRALVIRQSALGPGDPDVARSMLNLAGVYKAQGLYRRVEPLVQQALGIQEAVLGPDHPDVALSLVNLAALYGAQGQPAKAEPLARRALDIQEAALGPRHPDVAGSLAVLATLEQAQGMLPDAESLAQEALSIREEVLGPRHPDVAASLLEVAAARVAEGRLDEAVPLLDRALAMSEDRLRREALDFSESRLTAFLELLRASQEQLCAFARAHPEHAGLRRLALAAALLWKGRSVQETATTSLVVYRSLGPEDRAVFARLRESRSQLARLSFDGPRGLSREDYQAQVGALVEQGDALEAALAKRSARLRALVELPRPADIVDRVAAALPRDAALVELIAYSDPSIPAAPSPPADPLRYLALVLLPGAEIRLLDLGPAQPIDEAAAGLRDALASRAAGYQQVSRRLHALVLEPLLPLLGTRRSVYLSTDGQLSMVPFAALHDGRGFAGDTHSFTYLTSGKDLLPRGLESAPSRSVVVFADPAFGVPAAPVVASADVDPFARTRRSFSSVPSAPSLPRGAARGGWARLPGTLAEARALQRLFPGAQLFVGEEATKDRLLGVVSPGILHVATHGFFLADAPGPAGGRAIDVIGPSGLPPMPAEAADPLLRSGLVLAGAAPPGAAGEAAPDLDRSMVTALELAGLDLWGTQLIVLSACDTGRGAIKLGQGVYGLRRALVVAGAETVVMSLWKVDDDVTRALMEAYYGKLLAGKGRTAALREAMQALRRKRPHPHDWAPFISLGRDAPLQLQAAP